MNLNEREQAEVVNLKVLPLFDEKQEDILEDDPLQALLAEALLEEQTFLPSEVPMRNVAREDQFPDQSLYVLDEQLRSLRSSLNRIKFYLGELEDILPR